MTRLSLCDWEKWLFLTAIGKKAGAYTGMGANPLKIRQDAWPQGYG
jgi:hypothetical protein